VVGFLMQSAADVRTALKIGMHHLRLHSPNTSAELTEGASFASVSVAFLQPDTAGQVQTLDLSIAMMFNVMRTLCGHHWHPTEVRLAHARPRNVAPFRQFFHAPLVFDAAETGLVFAGRWLGKPLASADPLLHLMMQERVSELERLSRGDLASQLRRLLPALLSERVASAALAATRLGLGVRTLNRRLADEGTSFMKLRDEARYSIARQLLEGTRLPAGQIADHVGYANASAFTAAFRRWSGMGPAQWRASRNRPSRKRSKARGRDATA
jgi:AraC-like DNA-binding protein